MDLLNQTIEELKVALKDKFATEASLDQYLRNKGFRDDELGYVKAVMLDNYFSIMNGKVTFRGEDYLDVIPPNMPH